MKEISIVLPDEPGQLAKVSRAMANAEVNIETICAIGRVAPNVAIVTHQVEAASKVLVELGIEHHVEELISMVMPDVPGSLARFAETLGNADVNIRSIYVLSKRTGDTELVFSVDNVQAARQALNLHESSPP